MDPFFTPRETLELMAGFYGVPTSERRTDEILDALGLGDKKHAYVRQLSGGMKRRLMVAKALVHTPPILILDEPTAGVDVELRRSLWEYVRKLNASGTTIVLTTHYLEEAQEMCDTIAIINHGARRRLRADAETAAPPQLQDAGGPPRNRAHRHPRRLRRHGRHASARTASSPSPTRPTPSPSNNSSPSSATATSRSATSRRKSRTSKTCSSR